jgi:outer membrane protein assembly factor BamD
MFKSSSSVVANRVAIIVFCSLFLGGCFGSGDAKPHEIISRPEANEKALLEQAMQAYERELFSVASDLFTQLKDGFPTSPWTVLAEIKAADAHYYSNGLAEAITGYEEFARRHPEHEALAYVRFMTGMANLRQFRGRNRDQAPLQLAIKHFTTVSSEHSDSAFSAPSRRLVQQCRKMLAQHELLVAQYYINQELDLPAARRLCTVIRDYPDLEVAETAKAALDEHFIDKPEIIAKAQQSVVAFDQEKLTELAPSTPQVVVANTVTPTKEPIEESRPVRARMKTN